MCRAKNNERSGFLFSREQSIAIYFCCHSHFIPTRPSAQRTASGKHKTHTADLDRLPLTQTTTTEPTPLKHFDFSLHTYIIQPPPSSSRHPLWQLCLCWSIFSSLVRASSRRFTPLWIYSQHLSRRNCQEKAEMNRG